jgi:hypothetical protein
MNEPNATISEPTDLIELPFSQKIERFVSDVFGGQHHLQKLTDKGSHVVCVPYGTLATYDDDKLTRIVVECHRLGLRAEIDNHGMRGVKILLHNRKCRTGRLWERHPELKDVQA